MDDDVKDIVLQYVISYLRNELALPNVIQFINEDMVKFLNE